MCFRPTTETETEIAIHSVLTNRPRGRQKHLENVSLFIRSQLVFGVRCRQYGLVRRGQAVDSVSLQELGDAGGGALSVVLGGGAVWPVKRVAGGRVRKVCVTCTA